MVTDSIQHTAIRRNLKMELRKNGKKKNIDCFRVRSFRAPTITPISSNESHLELCSQSINNLSTRVLGYGKMVSYECTSTHSSSDIIDQIHTHTMANPKRTASERVTSK